MSDVKFYDEQGSARMTALIAYYERYREQKGSTDQPQMEAVRFAEFLLDRLDEFQEELREL